MRPKGYILFCLLLYCSRGLAINKDSIQEVSWLRSVILPARSVEMNSDDKDLKPLKKFAGDAKVVALGEVTHGSSEIYKMKGKMVKYLVEKLGYNVFSIEAPMPEAFKLNEYITGGKGDPRALLKNMHLQIWETQEMLDLVNWMKSYNDLHRKKIIFTGLDISYYEGAFTEITRIYNKYAADTGILNMLSAKLEELNKYRNKHYRYGINYVPWNKGELIKTSCLALQKFAGDSIPIPRDREWLLQNVRLIQWYTEQYANSTTTSYRDSCMAVNFLWTYEQYPNAKFIVWAHNEHIRKDTHYFGVSMGAYIYKELKQDYLPVGFTFHAGSFTSGGKGLHTDTASTSCPGSYEYFFHSAAQPLFMLDMSKVPADSKFLHHMRFRLTGIKEQNNEFAVRNIKNSFDMVVFIDRSTNSTLLR